MSETRLPHSVAVIGAGIAGLACARALAARGVAVRLFDKGRAPGGRVATRRAQAPDGGALQFDHGAQYASARGPGFAVALRDAGAAVAPWPDPQRFVGVPGMSALARHLAGALPVVLARHVLGIGGAPGAWTVRHLDAAQFRPGRPVPPEAAAMQEDGPFDAVALTLPAPQALPLVAPLLPAAALARLDAVRIAPCWTAWPHA